MLYTNDINAYLKCDDIVDYQNGAVAQLADALYQNAGSELAFVKAAYEYVRDEIAHSADIGEDRLTCTASEVLQAGHGICFAKSHLLAALLRCKAVPAGFCYQKLLLEDEPPSELVYHGLNGVYLRDCQKWIRLDARGNKNGVNAQFSIDREQLAYPVRPAFGEEDDGTIYPAPSAMVIEKLKAHSTRTALWRDLPTALGYNSRDRRVGNA